MARRLGFLGGAGGGDVPELDADGGFGTGAEPGFDPVWGTLGALTTQNDDDWLDRSEDAGEGVAVEIFGNDFHLAGEIRIGQFDRLSDWINMQSGFIAVGDATHLRLGRANAPDPNGRRGTLWLRISQIVMVAKLSAVPQGRPGAPVVQKQQRNVLITTPGYSLQGNLHIHAHGAMTQFLESPDTKFLPITDLTVRWLSDSALVARFPFAMVSRDQIVTVCDGPTSHMGDLAESDAQSA